MTYVTDWRARNGLGLADLGRTIRTAALRVLNAIIRVQERRAARLVEEYRRGNRYL